MGDITFAAHLQR